MIPPADIAEQCKYSHVNCVVISHQMSMCLTSSNKDPSCIHYYIDDSQHNFLAFKTNRITWCLYLQKNDGLRREANDKWQSDSKRLTNIMRNVSKLMVQWGKLSQKVSHQLNMSGGL